MVRPHKDRRWLTLARSLPVLRLLPLFGMTGGIDGVRTFGDLSRQHCHLPKAKAPGLVSGATAPGCIRDVRSTDKGPVGASPDSD